MRYPALVSARHPLLGALLLCVSAALHASEVNTRLTRPHLLAPEFTVVHHNPDPEYYVEGPGLARLDDGTLLAVVPVVPRAEWSRERRVEKSVAHILRSDDRGATWKKLSELPYYSAVPWTHDGKLYLFGFTPGPKFRNDDLHLLRSDDGGATWSAPVTLFKGHYWNCHTGMVVRDGHLYWAFDDLGKGNDNRGPAAIACDLSRDPMDPASWRISNSVYFTPESAELSNPAFASQTTQYIEPNVIDANGRLRVLMAFKPKRQTTSNMTAVFDLADKDGKLDLKFTQYSPMPGAQLKFTVLWDEKSRMFWSTYNLVVDSQSRFDWWQKAKAAGKIRSTYGGNDRRLLMLQYSLDGLNWFQAGCIAQAEKLSQSFMYARPVIDGDDLAILCRSSIDAPDQHDADYATFHRVKNFRDLALDLFPAPEN